MKHKLKAEGDRLSRGQRQRLKRRIAHEENEANPKPAAKVDPSNPNPQDTTSKDAALQKPVLSAKDKIQEIMRKRDKKMQAKVDQANQNSKSRLTTEDKKIMNQVKNKKKEQRREARRNEAQKAGLGKAGAAGTELDDQFDHLLSQYKDRVLKKIEKNEKSKKVEVGESGASFQEVDCSD